MKTVFLDEVSSTNEYIRQFIPAGEDVIVCAKRQTGGKGTKGRSFLSEEGGVYLTALTFYPDLPASEAFRIMTHAAVAVCRTAVRYGVNPAVKWPNDVLLGKKKLCGILIENGLSQGRIKYSVVGIGVNVRNDISALGGIATSLAEAVKEPPTVEEVRTALIENYLRPSTFEEYLSFVQFLGKPVRMEEGGREYDAVARRILPDGRLEIEDGEGIRALSSAEIRLKY